MAYLLKGKLKGFEQEYIFPAPLIDPIGKIAKEWHVSNRSHKVNKYIVEKAILKFGSQKGKTGNLRPEYFKSQTKS